MEKTSSISRFLYTWVILFIVWLTFTTTFDSAEVLAGLSVSFIVAVLSFKFFTNKGLSVFTPKKIIYLVQYLFVFLAALVKSNFSVARIVLSPKLPIKPGIVEFETKLTSDFAKMVLANSITLTPGTLSVDVIENRFYVHWLVVECKDESCAQKQIAEDFEKILIKIYE